MIVGASDTYADQPANRSSVEGIRNRVAMLAELAETMNGFLVDTGDRLLGSQPEPTEKEGHSISGGNNGSLGEINIQLDRLERALRKANNAMQRLSLV